MRSLYQRFCPETVKTVIEPVYGLLPCGVRFGKAYRTTRDFLIQSDTWDSTRLQSYQAGRLRHLVQHAIKTVPFYQRLHERGAVDPDSIRVVGDVKALPLISKEEIRGKVDDFLSTAFRRVDLHEATTGGSSGEPFHFYSTARERSVEWAFVHHLWARAGFSPSDWRVVLRGAHIGGERDGRHWQFMPKSRELVLSGYHLDDANMRQYHDLIQSRGLKFLHCYPSSGYLFATFLLRSGLRLPLKAVLATSETVHAFQREALEDAFQCRVYSFYGLSEHVCLAGECEHSELYHVQPQYGVTEILDESGRDVTAAGQIGEIVATGFLNEAMPFIRYRTGDHAMVSQSRCRCGRDCLLLEKLVGRSYEYVVTSRQTVISLTALVFAQHFAAFRRIKKMQIVQERIGEITVVIVREADYTPADEHEIKSRFKECVPDGLSVRFQYVDSIAPAAGGKHRFMVQHLSIVKEKQS